MCIFSTTAWYFFVLMQAYYSGAMTMFFSSEVKVPFNDIRDVIRSYPDWILMIQAGMQYTSTIKVLYVLTPQHVV